MVSLKYFECFQVGALMINAKQVLAVGALALLIASSPAKASPVMPAGLPNVSFNPSISDAQIEPEAPETLSVVLSATSGADAKLIGLSGTLEFFAGNGQTFDFTISGTSGTFSHIFTYSTPGIYDASYSFNGVSNEIANSGYTLPDPQTVNKEGEFAKITILAPVPEPSTWAMMILGFMGLGLMGYRRRKRALA
jgi:hypothetical protein